MKAVYIFLMLLWPEASASATLSGNVRLDHQNILITDQKIYHGQFDLRSELPVGDEYVLSKVIVSFKFQDDQEWASKAGESNLTDSGKIVRRRVFSLKDNGIAGRTDHYFTSKSIIYLSNEEEVAKLTIGRNVYFATTMRRRDVNREVTGRRSMLLGIYPDEGDQGRLRQHHRITESVVETRRDGYDGLFEMRLKALDLTSAQDLAHEGMLNFELSGTGDYTFVEATLQYEGYTSGGEFSKQEPVGTLGRFFTWLGLISLPIGGLLWMKRNRPAPPRRRRRVRATP
ncbi:hypothetical protein MNBD_ALPHA02-1562 [hydrothermal vent metagenome]|uniref:Transmembrane protein n=1 Tax=hydrothermal vent metagenome TaxID=652676 RepID=A0A3B0RPD5_9ZZZZ